jgi:hypothetical protein
MQDGVFSKEVYLNRLHLSRITPEAFESLRREEMTLTKMKHLIELSVDVTDISTQLPRTSENEQAEKMIQAALNDKKEKRWVVR